MLPAARAERQCMVIKAEGGGMVPADLEGPLAPPAGTPNTAVGYRRNSLMLYRFRVDWGPAHDSFLEPTTIPVAPFAEACFATRSGACVKQPGPGAPALDALPDRMMFRAAYRNFGRRDSLVVNHSVMAGGATRVRSYQVREPPRLPPPMHQRTYPPDASFLCAGSAPTGRAGNVPLA